jgi:hypothetical protein
MMENVMYISDHKRLLVNEIVKLGLNKFFYFVDLDMGDFGDSLSMRIESKAIPVKSTGLYAIYGIDEDFQEECLYVGQSEWCVNQRIRRFFKELACCSHPDEEHAGARRAREAGYTIESHTYKVKYVSWHEIYDIQKRLNITADFYNLDEYIAHHLKSKYNSSTYPLYGYNGATLKQFLEAA